MQGDKAQMQIPQYLPADETGQQQTDQHRQGTPPEVVLAADLHLRYPLKELLVELIFTLFEQIDLLGTDRKPLFGINAKAPLRHLVEGNLLQLADLPHHGRLQQGIKQPYLFIRGNRPKTLEIALLGSEQRHELLQGGGREAVFGKHVAQGRPLHPHALLVLQEGGIGVGLQGDARIPAAQADLVDHPQQGSDQLAIEGHLTRRFYGQLTDLIADPGQLGQSLIRLLMGDPLILGPKSGDGLIHRRPLLWQGIGKLAASRADKPRRHAPLFLQLMNQLGTALDEHQHLLGLLHLLRHPITVVHVVASEKHQRQ